MNATQLTCEYMADPMGVETGRPRLAWAVEPDRRGQMQGAYRVLAASTPEKLAAGEGDAWDTGRVASGKSVHVEWEGKELASGQTVHWKVQVWDADGQEGPWSEPARFEMGLMKQEDWKARWIGAAKGAPAPLLRRRVTMEGEVARARLYVSGLGWYEAYINGRRVGEDVLDAAATEYDKTVLYAVHDVTGMLARGVNAIGVMLGNGWYCEPGVERYGDSPRLRLQLQVEYADGRRAMFVSDESWRTGEGAIVRNDFWNGEEYDARREVTGWAEAGFDDSAWPRALAKTAPGGKMAAQLLPPMRVMEHVRAQRMTCPAPGVYVFDFGRLFGGWTTLRVKGPAGTKVTIGYSARLNEATGLLDRCQHPEEGKNVDVYILKGDAAGETYQPRFTYHSVQYVQVEGLPEEPDIHALEGCAVYSAVDLTGEFESSSPLLNRIHQNVLQTFKNGLFGLPLDCLYREHWAWTDPATITGTLYARRHMPQFWIKWLRDIADSQGPDGLVPHVCPTYHGQHFDAAWGGNYPTLVWYLWQYFGDDRMLAEHYDGMKRCVDYMTSVSEGHIVVKGLYGDHMMPGAAPGKEEFISSETPRELVWTGYYYRAALVLARIADRLGKSADAASYAALAAAVAEAFNARWYDPHARQYAGGAQTANIFPLALGIVPEEARPAVLARVARSLRDEYHNHHHTGNTGTTCLIDMLTKSGEGDLWYQVLTNPTYPGWAYMVEQGATTIWESWSLIAGCGSAESMIMWATIDKYLLDEVGGIKSPDYYEPTEAPAGFEQVRIAPYFPHDVHFLRCSVRTVRGLVRADWWRNAEYLWYNVSVPGNTKALLSIPTMGLSDVVVKEGPHTIWQKETFQPGPEGIASAEHIGESITLHLGPGEYRFMLTKWREE